MHLVDAAGVPFPWRGTKVSGPSARPDADAEVQRFMRGLVRRNPGEAEFHQAVLEFVETVMPFVLEHPEYREARILERMTEPDRIVIFRVPWEDDTGQIRADRAWRVQFNNAIGPYKGGLRFHWTVNQSILKFLGFEQCFKNALTGLPMGGAKGGANFDPRNRSEREIMRFCQSMMIELHRHIGEDTDVPAGDIGVGTREISYLFGQYKRMQNRFTGILTGKGLTFGGSLVRTEATGYGCVYFADQALQHRGESLAGKTCTLSGSGNVAIYTAEKALQLAAKVVTLSDSDGTIHDPAGIDEEKLAFVKELKEVRRGRIHEYAERFKCEYMKGRRPWSVPCDVALPCATQNELTEADAKTLLANGCTAVVEGANMPTTLEAVHVLQDAGCLFLPGKAANAGGVAVSGLEQSQNAIRISWSRDEVDGRLRSIMNGIHEQCLQWGTGEDGSFDYVKGANLASFQRVGQAMLAYGIV
jgi:glutamate dehydrogenase (NADP+)